MTCPDCSGVLNLIDRSKDVYWCVPCKRARHPEHMEKYVAPVRPPKPVPAETAKLNSQDRGTV